MIQSTSGLNCRMFVHNELGKKDSRDAVRQDSQHLPVRSRGRKKLTRRLVLKFIVVYCSVSQVVLQGSVQNRIMKTHKYRLLSLFS
jgi:hypothetical protein